jgi:HD superfamily phosphohydrolase
MIEELHRFSHPASIVRIPPETDVPLSPRVVRMLDTSAMRRLTRVTQLGLVHLVYPGATHSRFEHSLGVYRNTLLVLHNLILSESIRPPLPVPAIEAMILAALLHDAGHWPFCHAIEDMRIERLTRHESRVAALIQGDEVDSLIREDWQCGGDDVMSLLLGKRIGACELPDAAIELLASCLSGPIDVDKLDYLVRDSLHAGVPYGRHFDSGRLIAAMTVDPRRPRLAITEKGRTAAEMMVFARYVMFSEVYWHHAVRSATAMLQRSVHELRHQVDIESMMRLDDAAWIQRWRSAAAETPAADLVEGLFGPVRSLYKRVAEFNLSQRGELHRQLARRPYPWLVACAEQLARQLAAETGLPIRPCDILIDAPPVKLEVDINVAVVAKDGAVRALADVSPVADALARQQFDDHVKRVRIFVHPRLREDLASPMANNAWLERAIQNTCDEIR